MPCVLLLLTLPRQLQAMRATAAPHLRVHLAMAHSPAFLGSERSLRASCRCCAPGGERSNFKWDNANAFEGDRVLEMKRRQRSVPSTSERIRNVWGNLRSANPGTLLLIAVFIPLTIADLFFNVSRGFLCILAESLCAPVPPY